jgi:hypothetical protein
MQRRQRSEGRPAQGAAPRGPPRAREAAPRFSSSKQQALAPHLWMEAEAPMVSRTMGAWRCTESGRDDCREPAVLGSLAVHALSAVQAVRWPPGSAE